MKLLRPLHRQRARRRTRFTVLGNEDLAAHYCVRLDELEQYLTTNNLPYHKDGCGNLWASCKQFSHHPTLQSANAAETG